jgi:5-methyltetrahydrofolate--homocysteine methyltransferase
VADGATGTNLQKLGLPPGAHAEDWVFEAPAKILELEGQFLDAGSDIILTCTFGGSAVRLRSSKYFDRTAEINRRAVELAQEAVSRRPGSLIAGSLGPLGQLLKPYGPIAHDEAQSAYAEQAQALTQAGVDVLVIETQFSLEECDAALAGVQDVSDLPVVVSFSYDRGLRTMMGVKPRDVIERYGSRGIAMVGVNCGTTLENALAVIREYRATGSSLPIWAKPNAGMPRLVDGVSVYDVGPAAMARFGQEALEFGASVIGGCCGSTPEHVKAIAGVVWQARSSEVA